MTFPIHGNAKRRIGEDAFVVAVASVLRANQNFPSRDRTKTSIALLSRSTLLETYPSLLLTVYFKTIVFLLCEISKK